MDQDNHLIELRALFEEYKKIHLPKTGGIDINLKDADIDMFEEDTYLFGIVSSYLATGYLKDEAILIDESIDFRIGQACEELECCSTLVMSFQEYRQRMVSLAKALSVSSGIPIRYMRDGIEG